MTTLIAFIVVIGFLVFVHELGHFLVAKWVGVRVHVFSIGFGPRLFGFRRGDTDYRISALPLGGFVKMAGENPGEEVTGAPYEFASRSVRERMAIVLAGPFMNIIWAILFFAMVFYIGEDQPAYLKQVPQIGWIESGSPAEEAGLQAGDLLVAIGDSQVSTWEEAFKILGRSEGREVAVRVKRGDQVLTSRMDLSRDRLKQSQTGLGLYPPLPAVIGNLRPGWPAEKVGLKTGDRVVAINDQPITHWYELTRVIHNSPGVPVKLEVERNGERLTFEVTPRKDEADGKGYIGMTPYQETIKVRYGVLGSFRQSLAFNWHVVKLTGSYIWKVMTGEQSGKAIGGPIAIAQFAGEAARIGILQLIRLMGLLSLQLGLLNLLPIPVLDGGHMVLLAIEGVSGKPLSVRMREVIQIIGVAVLLAIMTYAIFNDLSRIFSP